MNATHERARIFSRPRSLASQIVRPREASTHSQRIMHAKRSPRSTNGGNRAHLSKRGSAAMLNGRAAFDLFPLAARCCCCGGMYRAPAGLRLKPSTSGDTRSARSATNSVRPDFPMILVEMESSQIDRPCLRSVCLGESLLRIASSVGLASRAAKKKSGHRACNIFTTTPDPPEYAAFLSGGIRSYWNSTA